MDPSHPTAARSHAEEEAAGDTSAPLPKTRTEKMDLLLSTILSIQKDISNVLASQKSFERIAETRYHTLNNKVDALTRTVTQLKHEVDGVPSPHTTTTHD